MYLPYHLALSLAHLPGSPRSSDNLAAAHSAAHREGSNNRRGCVNSADERWRELCRTPGAIRYSAEWKAKRETRGVEGLAHATTKLIATIRPLLRQLQSPPRGSRRFPLSSLSIRGRRGGVQPEVSSERHGGAGRRHPSRAGGREEARGGGAVRGPERLGRGQHRRGGGALASRSLSATHRP